jgi:hypothetical protein
MAPWAAKDLVKEKIFVLGHSWGSFLGLQIAEILTSLATDRTAPLECGNGCELNGSDQNSAGR